MSRLGLVASVTLVALGALTANAAAGMQPQNLQVDGGEESWHADSDFRLDWTNPAPPEKMSIAAVHYRVRNPADAVVVADTRIDWAANRVGVHVPGIPSVYTAEVWLEDNAGGQWAPVEAKLRFDDSRPGPVGPLAPSNWIGRTALPYAVHLSHPTEPLPLSGIRGYAVVADALPDSTPCADSAHCTDAEVDLHGGIEDDSWALAELPEGTSYVHAVAVSGAGLKSPTAASGVLHVDTADPVTTLSGVPGGWANRPVALLATAVDSTSGMRAGGSDGPFTAIRVDDLAPTVAPGSSASTTVIGDGVHTIAYYARDAAGNVNDGGAGNGVANRPPSTTTVRIDRTAPSASFLNAQSPEDPEAIEVRIADGLSGVDSSKGQISVRRTGSGEPFDPLPTEVAGARLRARWDSDAYPAGEYEFRATGYDAAGNTVVTEQRANGASMVLPSPLKIPTAMQAGFGGRVLVWHRCERHGERRRCRRQVVRGFEQRPSARVLPYGRPTLFSGRLTAGLGSPLGQVPVKIIERFAPGASTGERVTFAMTDADGMFTARLAPGPSRQVSAVFLGTRTLSRSSAAPIRLGVLGGVRMRPSAAVATVGGRPVVFAGKVEAGDTAIPAGGKSVQLQFRLPGLPWTEFRTIQTDPAGHFRYPYRFADDDSRGVRFEFRAFAPAQNGWPYEPAASAPVAVTGR